MANKSLDLVLIEWIDIHASAHWESRADASSFELPTMYTVGWLLKKTSEVVVTSATLGGDEVNTTMTFPRSCVTSIKKLKCPKVKV